MCTLTYLPLNANNFILTSNRDESPMRTTISPKKYIENGVEMTYPKDALAGGTWIGLSQKKRLVCLLNGGFKKHLRKDSYRMSRGIIVKELLAADSAVEFIKGFDFIDIEPFTIVLIDWAIQLTLYELVWDGSSKHFHQLKNEPAIWSSTSLYADDIKLLRKEWFVNWLKEHPTVSQKDILQFHSDTSKGTPDSAIKMKRNFVETVSITSIHKTTKMLKLQYADLNAGSVEEQDLFY